MRRIFEFLTLMNHEKELSPRVYSERFQLAQTYYEKLSKERVLDPSTLLFYHTCIYVLLQEGSKVLLNPQNWRFFPFSRKIFKDYGALIDLDGPLVELKAILFGKLDSLKYSETMGLLMARPEEAEGLSTLCLMPELIRDVLDEDDEREELDAWASAPFFIQVKLLMDKLYVHHISDEGLTLPVFHVLLRDFQYIYNQTLRTWIQAKLFAFLENESLLKGFLD